MNYITSSLFYNNINLDFQSSGYDDFIEYSKRIRQINKSIPLECAEACQISPNELGGKKDLPARFWFNKNGFRFDFFYAPQKNSARLYLVFSGSRMGAPLPVFKRHSWNCYFDGSVLYIADPMLSKYDNLNIGWYLGDNACDIYSILAKVIYDFKKARNYRQIISYGSSGGGFAAMKLAEYLASWAIVINPQISPMDYINWEHFIEKTGLAITDEYRRRCSLCPSGASKYFIIQNETEKHDIDIQLFPFLASLGISPRYGLFRKKNLNFWIYHAFGGHNSQEDRNILQFILFLGNRLFASPDEQKFNELNNLAISFSNIWADLAWYRYMANYLSPPPQKK